MVTPDGRTEKGKVGAQDSHNKVGIKRNESRKLRCKKSVPQGGHAYLGI
jgi:hypothetical protein